MVGSEPFLRRRLGVICGIAGADVTHNVGEAAGTEDDDVRAQVVVDLVAIDFHFGTAA
jgi:hypothetical protein